jgi:acylpyruvate hydrolase
LRLATIRHEGRTFAAEINGESATLFDAIDVGELLRRNEEETTSPARVAEVPTATARFAPLVLHPSKIICVGLNYKAHIEEMGEEAPEFPTLFAKFADALIGASDEILLPHVSTSVDWEVELVAVIGKTVRHADEAAAADSIAGFTVGNDISARDFQSRTSQWLQGKTFANTSPLGPSLVTADELGAFPDLEIRCEVDGEVKQHSRTSDLLRSPAELVAYISAVVPLRPGDLIFTGTPGGTGQGQVPPVGLAAGQSVASTIEGIGALLNPCVAE